MGRRLRGIPDQIRGVNLVRPGGNCGIPWRHGPAPSGQRAPRRRVRHLRSDGKPLARTRRPRGVRATRLGLLPPGPDPVHGRPDSRDPVVNAALLPPNRGSSPSSGEFGPACRGFQVQGTPSAPLSTPDRPYHNRGSAYPLPPRLVLKNDLSSSALRAASTPATISH